MTAGDLNYSDYVTQTELARFMGRLEFIPSNYDGTVDITSEYDAAMAAADLAGKILRFPVGTFWIQGSTKRPRIEGAGRGMTYIINQNDDPSIRSTDAQAVQTANTTGFDVTSITRELYVDPYASDDNYVSVLNVSSNPITAGVRPGDKVHIHSQNDHRMNYKRCAANPLTTTSGSKTIRVVTAESLGVTSAGTFDVRIWDTSGAITDVNGIPAAEIFTTDAVPLSHTATYVSHTSSTTTFDITVATTTASSTGSPVIANDVVRAVRKKDFLGEPATVFAVTENKILLSEELVFADYYTTGIRCNTLYMDNWAYVSDITFKGKNYDDQVTRGWVETAGTGYSANFTVTGTGGGGTGFQGTAVVSGGAIVGFIVTNHGSGYTSAPTADLSAGSGTGGSIILRVGGTVFDSDYDVPGKFHNHTLGIWYCPGSLIERVDFEDMWEGTLEPRFSSFTVAREINCKKLPNYRTGAGSPYSTYFPDGRLGYGPANPYSSAYCVFEDIKQDTGRHGLTDGSGDRETYDSAEYIGMCIPVRNKLTGFEWTNIWGTGFGPHETGTLWEVTNGTIRVSLRGSEGGSYSGSYIQLRGSRHTISNVICSGGAVEGVRVQADSEQWPSGSWHLLKDVIIKDCNGSSGDTNGCGMRVPSTTASSKTSKFTSTIILDDVTFERCGRGIRADDYSDVKFDGKVVVKDVGDRSINLNASGKIWGQGEFVQDYTKNTKGYASRQGITLAGACEFSIQNITTVLGASVNPATVIAQQDTTAGKIINPVNVRFINPSAVTLPGLINTSAGRPAALSWSEPDSVSQLRQPFATEVTAAATTACHSWSGRLISSNHAGAVTHTIPNSVPKGWQCEVYRSGAGNFTIAVEAGGTLNKRLLDSLTSAEQWETKRLTCLSNADGASAIIKVTTL